MSKAVSIGYCLENVRTSVWSAARKLHALMTSSKVLAALSDEELEEIEALLAGPATDDLYKGVDIGSQRGLIPSGFDIALCTELALHSIGFGIMDVTRVDNGLHISAQNMEGESIHLSCQPDQLLYDMVGFEGEKCEKTSQLFIEELKKSGVTVNRITERKHFRPMGTILVQPVARTKSEEIMKNPRNSRKRQRSLLKLRKKVQQRRRKRLRSGA